MKNEKRHRNGENNLDEVMNKYLQFFLKCFVN